MGWDNQNVHDNSLFFLAANWTNIVDNVATCKGKYLIKQEKPSYFGPSIMLLIKLLVQSGAE